MKQQTLEQTVFANGLFLAQFGRCKAKTLRTIFGWTTELSQLCLSPPMQDGSFARPVLAGDPLWPIPTQVRSGRGSKYLMRTVF